MTATDAPFPGEWPEQRVALFVDTQNLYYSARENYDRQVNYETLLNLAVRGRRLILARAFVVEREGDSTAFGFVTKLTSLGYRVSRRLVRMHRVGEAGQLVLEGDWDMGIAADIVRALDHFDVLVLASGDGDFTPIVQLVQEKGKRVEVLAFRESAAQSLLDAADRFLPLPDQDAMLMAART